MLDPAARILQQWPLAGVIALALAWNVLAFTFCLAAGRVVVSRYTGRRVTPAAPPITQAERLLAAACVTVNALVTVAGIALWRGGLIRLHRSAPLGVLLDTLVLVLAMDAAMYALHRLAHHPLAFRLVHGVHHRYEDPRPLTLFVLHPLEVLGFGTLWVLVIIVYPASAAGIACYLTLNLAFGLLGHLGVEPLPAAWLRLPVLRTISTSTFHAEHHQARDVNFGFYTLLWDRLFGTLAQEYSDDFLQAVAGNRSPSAQTLIEA